jgi:predicted DNA-binding transcriptional regulator YafY
MLSLLQAHPGVSATQLAARLGVTERIKRRDVANLKEATRPLAEEGFPRASLPKALSRPASPACFSS